MQALLSVCSFTILCAIQMSMTFPDDSNANFLSYIPISHLQPSVLIVSYIESAEAAAQFGFYQKAEWKPDDSMIAVAVSKQIHHLILYWWLDWYPELLNDFTVTLFLSSL